MRSFLSKACAVAIIAALPIGAYAADFGTFAQPKSDSHIILAATTSTAATSAVRTYTPPPVAAKPPSSLGLPPARPPVQQPNGIAQKPGVTPVVGVAAGAAAGVAAQPSPNGLPGKPGAATSVAAAPPPSAVTTAASRTSSQAALDRYRSSTVTKWPAAAPIAPTVARTVPVYRSVAATYPTRATYYRAYETGWRSYPTPLVIYRPSYGIWDSHVFAAVLISNSINNYAWLYAMEHSQDAANRAAYEQWHADMADRAANDAAIRAQLAAVDAKLSTMQPPTTVPQLPDGVNPAMAVAPSTVLADDSIPDDSPTKSNHTWIWILLGVVVVVGVGGALLMASRGRAYREGRM